MDPISLIIAAVVAGASAAVQDTASSVVKDAYVGLRRIISRRFSGNPAAEQELTAAEAGPEPDTSGLAARLRAIGADRDEELLAAARQLLERVDPSGARAGKYQVHITGGKGTVVGDHASVTMNFNDND